MKLYQSMKNIRLTNTSTFILLLIIVGLSSCKRDDWEAGTEAPLDYLVKDGVTIVQNPYGRSPLSAAANFKSFDPCKVKVEIDGDIPIEYEVDYDKDHATPIIGLYHNAVNKVKLTITDQEGVFAIKEFEITIGYLDERLPNIEVNVPAGNVEEGMTFCDMHLANNGAFATNMIAVDNDGIIRWHLDLTEYGMIVWPLQRFYNGNLFMCSDQGIYEFNMLGKELNHWSIPGYRAHHDMIELPNGNFLVSVQKYGTSVNASSGTYQSTDDFIIEFNPHAGSIVDEWDLRQIMDIDRYDVVEDNIDWFHMNALWYSESDDCIIVSGRNQGLVKIDRGNNLKWILAAHRGWGQAGVSGDGFNTSDHLLTAVNGAGVPYDTDVQDGTMRAPDFDWTWGQHAPLLLGNGNLLVFDNGYNRQFGAADPYSRAVEYSIDQSAMTVKQIWEWGMERGAPFFSLIISDVDVLPQTGNRLVTSGFTNQGSEAKVVELSYPNNMEQFEITLGFKNVNSTAQGWGQIDILYRAEKMSLFPN